MKKILLILSLLTLLLLIIKSFFYPNTHLEDYTQTTDFNPHWIINHNPDLKLERYFDQPFHYLAEGGQAIAFVNQEKDIVLKLFKYKRFEPSPLTKWLPDSGFKNFKQKHINKRRAKLHTAFESHRLALEKIPNQSGLIAVQLNPSGHNLPVTLITADQTQGQIDLGKTSYVLQLKGETFEKTLNEQIKAGQLQTVVSSINRLFALIVSEYQAGVYDVDRGLMHNYGFRGKTAMHIDIGKVVPLPSKTIAYQEFKGLNEKLKAWLLKKHPREYNQIKKGIEDSFNQHLNSLSEVIK